MVNYLTKRFVIEDRKYLYNHYFRKDDTLYIINNLLYEIEYLYLKKKLNCNEFIIYDIDFLSNGKKRVFVRLKGSNEIVNILIPKLFNFYESVDHYFICKCYYWLKPNHEVLKKYYYYRLYNRREHRYYKVGDYNGYGYKLIKICDEKKFNFSSNELKYVGLSLW